MSENGTNNINHSIVVENNIEVKKSGNDNLCATGQKKPNGEDALNNVMKSYCEDSDKYLQGDTCQSEGFNNLLLYYIQKGRYFENAYPLFIYLAVLHFNLGTIFKNLLFSRIVMACEFPEKWKNFLDYNDTSIYIEDLPERNKKIEIKKITNQNQHTVQLSNHKLHHELIAIELENHLHAFIVKFPLKGTTKAQIVLQKIKLC